MIINTPQAFKTFIDKASKETLIAFDTETTGLRPFHGDYIIGASFLLESDQSTYYVPVRHEYPCPDVNLSPDLFFSQLAVLFSNPELTVICHNQKFDFKFIEKEGVIFKGIALDSQILAHLWNENEHKQHNPDGTTGGYRLKEDLGKKYLSADADAEKRDLEECANVWKESQIAPIREQIEQLENTMKLIERDWKNELKEAYKAQLACARKNYNALKKKLEKEESTSLVDEVMLDTFAKEIVILRGKVEDINARKPADNLQYIPEYKPLMNQRKALMDRISEIRSIHYMSRLAHYPLETVARYAEQDVILTYKLFKFYKEGVR